jgi:hypothetical protein
MVNLIKKLILEEIQKINNITKVICDKCKHEWDLEDGGDEPYVCHNILSSGRMCNHDNTPKKKPKKKLNEDLQSNVIFLPYSDDYNEELEDYNIDEYDVEPQALNIAKQNNLNILKDKNLKGFLFDTTTNKIVGALWTSDDNNSFSFDIAIDKQYQGLKLSHLLIKNAIEEYNTQSDYGNFNLPMKVDVINPMLANILKTKYNFRVVKRISNDRVIMALKKKLKEEENILNEKCWKGYTQKGMKTMFGKRYPNCVKKIKEDEDYRIHHKAPSKNYGATMDRLTDIYPNDIYSDKALQYYGEGYPYDRLAIAIMQSAKGNPNKKIKIYRAVPKDVNTINDGDWVTTTKQYAQSHGKSVMNNDFKVISKIVDASTLHTDGNSIHEFGYKI